jgi:hypothetical protein
MKKILVVLISICSLVLLNGCGTATTPPQQVASHFSVTSATQAPVAGMAFNITITALDDKNSPVATYSGTVHFTSSDAQAVLPASAAITNGTGTGSVTLKTAGPQTVTATGTDSLTGTSNGVPVSAGPATQLSVSAASASCPTGAKFQFTVTAQDGFKNTATSYAGTVHFTSSDTNANVLLPANSALTSGAGNFSAVLQTVGSQSITATDTVTPSITGKLSSIAVTAPAALGITNGTLPDGAAGILYHEVCLYRTTCSSLNPLDATGGVPPYSWSWAAAPGSLLPPGLGISNIFHCQVHNQSVPCAAIIGMPSAAATYNVVLTVTDSATPAGQRSHTFPLTIIPKLLFTSGTPPDGIIGTPYNFTFTTSGGKPPITLSVFTGAFPAGLSFNANAGAVSGTPTTAELSNTTVVAVDSGGQQQHAYAGSNVTVNPPVVNNAELNGQYAFSFSGFGVPPQFSNQPASIVGSFTADGAGNLTGGLEDINGGTVITASQAFVGTYEIYSDNRGILNLKASPGGADLGTFRFAVGSINGGVASKARFVEFSPGRGANGGGLIEKQDPTAFATAKIAGDYAFGVSSVIRTASSAIANFGAAGRFTASSGAISSGTIDEDSDGTITPNTALTGTYSVAATGRGTMTLNVAGAATPVNLVFYVVSSNELLVQCSDAQSIGSNSLFAGTILHQTGAGTFSNASLNGASVIALQGVNNSGNDVVLGVLSIPTAGNFTLVGDENNLGALAALNQAGTYSVTSNGRVTVTGTPHPMVFYLLAANQGFVVGTDTNASTGFFEPQTGVVSSVNGNFFLGTSMSGNMFANSYDSGVEMFNGAGSVTGTMDTSVSNGPLEIQTFTDAYTIAMSGRGTITTSTFIFYVISPSKFVRMDGGAGANNATITVGEK